MPKRNKPLAPPKRTLAFEAPLSLAREVVALAEAESRPLAAMLRILLAEALVARPRKNTRPHARAGLKDGK